MERLGPLLNAFYTKPLSVQDRGKIHATLLETLQDAATLPHTLTYLSTLQETKDQDPYLLYYALHYIETTARNCFHTTQPSLRASLLQTLLTFQITAHTNNLTNTRQTPAHILNKAAVATTQLGLREWILSPSHTFPQTALTLCNQTGHTSSSAAQILTGQALLSTILEVATTPRKDIPTLHQSTLKSLLRNLAPSLLTALEAGTRISGPSFPPSLPLRAIRSIPALLRLTPTIAPEAIALLSTRITPRPRPDRLSATLLSVLADIHTASIPFHRDWPVAMAHVAGVLEPVAMHEPPTNGPDLEEIALFYRCAISYTEAVGTRVIASTGVVPPGLERVLNALMGVSVRWAADAPALFVCALEAWLAVFDALEDADVAEDTLLLKVYSAVSQLCVSRCLHATNATVLGSLDNVADGHSGSVPIPVEDIFAWDRIAESVAGVAADPTRMISALFIEEGGAADEDEDGMSCGRKTYVGKCVEALLSCARMSPTRVGVAVLDFSVSVLREKGRADIVHQQDSEDLHTAAYVAFCIVPLFPPDSSQLHGLFEVVCGLISARVSSRDADFGTVLFRMLASLAPLLAQTSPETVRTVFADLLPAVQDVLTSNAKRYQPNLASAATLLILSLDKHCRAVLFPSSPPLDLQIVSVTSYPSVAALGAAAMTRWSIVPERDANTSLPVKWSADEWSTRRDGFRRQSELMFGPFARACALGANIGNPEAILTIAKGAGLLKAMVLSVYSVQGNTAEALWQALGKTMSHECLKALAAFREQVDLGKSTLDQDAIGVVCGVMGCIVETIGSLLQVCRRQITSEASGLASETLDVVLEVARDQGSLRLGRAALRLLRDQFANGSPLLLAPGIELSVQTLEQRADEEVAVAAVGVLTEALKRHWKEFWPGDVAQRTSRQPAAPTPSAAEPVRKLYFLALQGLLRALRSEDLAVCRAALLSLQSLEAARRLYVRGTAFREAGAADMTVLECARILGAQGDAGRESLGDEAVEVVWGIAKVDMERFYHTVLPGVVQEIGGISPEQARALVEGFGKVADRPSFVRAFPSFANDFVYMRSLNSRPTL